MKKLLFLFLLAALPVGAQTVIPIVSGNANIDFSKVSATSFKINVTAPVTVNVINQPTSSPIVITILFSQDGTGHLVTFGSAFSSATVPTIPTTASSNTSVSFQYDGGSNSFYTVTPSAAGGAGTVTLVNTTAPVSGGPFSTVGTIGLNVGTPCSSGTFSQGLDSQLNSQCAPVPPSGGGTPPYVGPTAINGCGVEWTGLLTFTVGQCTYIINGITYNSAITNLTLAPADVTNPRIDDIIVDNTGTASALTGTPAASPAAPAVDPSTQLLLTFVTVAANATTPTGITSETIYDENVEWNTTKGGTNSARVALASSNNPFRGSVDIEFGSGGTVTTTTFSEATKPASGTENLSTWNFLVFYIRNKAAWATNRSITIQWLNGSTAVGTGIVLSNNNFGFNATTNFTTYQQVVIPTSYFQTGANAVTSLKFTVSGSGAALTGFYLDAISLQAGTAPTPPLPTTLMNYRGTYSSAVQYNPNDVVTVNGCNFVALVSNLNVAVTTTSTWSGTGSCANAKTGQIFTAVNGAPSTFLTPGIADGNGGAAVTSSPYTLKCDSGTAVLDGAHLIRFQSGAGTVTVPLSTAIGCTGNNMAFTIVDDGAGTLTVNRTSPDTFSTFNGSTNTDGATSFTLTNGSYATLNQGAAGIWEVRIVPASGSGTVTSAVIAGTSNQIAVSGTCTITTTGTCTVGFPSTIVIPSGSTATTQSALDNSTKVATTAYIDTKVVTNGSGTSVSLSAPAEIFVCTGTCTVTPPVPVAGYQFCVLNGDNVSTVITLAALGSSARYENTARTAYGTAGTGTFISGGAVKDQVCIYGLDSTHYLTVNSNGTWVAN